MGRVPGIVKWLLAPVAAALLGYGVIGPRMGGSVKLPKSVSEHVNRFVPHSETQEDSKPTDQSPSIPPPPEVTVDAKPADSVAPAQDEEKPKPRRRKRRRRRSTTNSESSTRSRVERAEPERTQPDPASTP